MAIRKSTLNLLRKLMVDVGGETDQATRALTRAWVRGWDELAAQWKSGMDAAVAQWARTGAWPQPWELARIERLAQALRDSEQALAQLGNRAGVLVADGAGKVVAATADMEPRLIASQLPAAEQATAAVRFAANIVPGALDVIVARSQAQIVSDLRPLSTDAMNAMRRELIRGVVVGDNPARVASQMVARVEGAFNGGLGRAVNVARTEMLDAYRTASRYTHAANADVVSGWTWVADLGPRCCSSCWSMHGRAFPVEVPGPQDHQMGRCARAPRTKTWRELGFDIDEPGDEIPDAQARFWALGPDVQRSVMGPGRLELLRTGRISWDDLPVERAARGWRTSFAPRTVGDLERIAGQRTARGIAPSPHPLAPKAPLPPATRPARPTRPAPAPIAKPKTDPKTPGRGPLPNRTAPKITDLMVDSPPDSPWQSRRDLSERVRADVKKAIDGTYGKLRVEVDQVTDPTSRYLAVSGLIYHPKSGEQVGTFSRSFSRDRDGKYWANHQFLRLGRDVQGSGFSQQFNRNLFDWYRRSGFDRVQTHADIDVGGYTWPTQGFDFLNDAAAADFAEWATLKVDRLTGLAQNPWGIPGMDRKDLLGRFPGLTAAEVDGQIAAMRNLIGAAKNTRPVSAYEFTQLGRKPGQGRHDMWIGKLLMLGSDYEAVLRL